MKKQLPYLLLLLLILIIIGILMTKEPPNSSDSDQVLIDNELPMQITSASFSHEGLIPALYTCDGQNINPPLSFAEIPEGTVSLALLMDDPDVPLDRIPEGVFDHWVAFNIPPTTTGVSENGKPEGGVEGLTTRDTQGYTGPCPPDREHRYFFRLYALDTMLDLDESAHKSDVLQAMEGHILQEAELMGRYNRPENEN